MKISKQIREIRVADIMKYTVIPLLFTAAVWVAAFLSLTAFPEVPSAVIYVVGGIASYVAAHYFAIGLVLCYKAFAPLEMRGKCRFEPTCSTYMIIAIKKYGLLIGGVKGIARIFRCRPPNGGVDYP